jgi:hypothetical protein
MMPAVLAPPLLERLLDDASQFPPGDLGLDEAVEEHAGWRQDPHARLVGRLLMPAARIGDLARTLAGDAGAWDLGIVVSADAQPSAAGAAAEALAATHAGVSAVELPLAAGAAAIEAWRRAFPDADLVLEGRARDLPRIAGLGAWAKLRCGGLTAGAVPDTATVGAFLGGCAELDLPFKATAGLHQPLRHFAPGVGAFQHGFLNLLAATARAIGGARAAELEPALLAIDLRSLELGSADLATARRLFTAFGTCSIREPIEGLETLGLLHA